MSELLYPTYTVEDSKYQDYVGFIFNGKHSSDLGIVRTSNGSRFDENLLPTIQDKTVQVPGGDGTYFFGSYFTQKQFTIPFAFDSLTEEKFKELKVWLGDKKIHDLIFDEAPYKVYKAKVTGSATIKHIPFGEGETNRLYKGEGSIQFTCYQPYARSRFKTLEEYKYIEISVSEEDFKANKYYIKNNSGTYVLAETYEEEATYYESGYENINEWSAASGILKANHEANEEKGTLAYSDFDSPGAGSINLYNPGCIDSHFKLRIDFSKEYTYQKVVLTEETYESNKYYTLTDGEYSISGEAYNSEATYFLQVVNNIIPTGGIKIGDNSLNWKKIELKGEDSYVVIDTKMNLIEGYDTKNKKTGEIYNEYITSGTFFKIPMGQSTMKLTTTTVSAIDYDYYYL